MATTSMNSFSLSMQQTPPGHPSFVNLDPKYTCLKCRDILRDAVQTLCGHRMCEVCAAKVFDEPPPFMCPGNDDTCVPNLKKEEIFRDPSARREIAKLSVFCPNKEQGCTQEMQWKQQEEHKLGCEYTSLQCSYVNNGCETRTIKKNLEEHLQGCEYRNVPCSYCKEDIIFNQKQDHESNQCMRYPIACPNNCGMEDRPREELKDHTPDCPNRPFHCKFRNVGCDFKGLKEDVTEHEQGSVDHHLQLTTVYTASVDLQSMEIRRELQDMSESQGNFKKTVDQCLSAVTSLREGMEARKKAIKEVKLQSVAVAERLIHLERRVEDTARKDTVDKQGNEIQTLRDGQTNLSNRVTRIEQNGLGNADGMSVGGNVGSKLQTHERQIGLMDIRLSELDLRLQIHETASFNGMLIWKLRDYARRKQEARNGRTLSLYSQPFYTSQFGYKMCARVYLNGDGMGKGTHVSLFFVVMRGDFDSLLPWPFQQKVTLMLLDQDTGKHKLSDSFKPDPNSNSFRKPQTEMNIASGCPVFVSQAVLETKTYLQEDTLFIKIEVDTNGINPP
ncbi:TNF receptor-associated factor 3-like [Mizuhopecten yessoensis]|uniref:TNF receptor-associated factor 3 n=1 Tax=Mizuhopecten yessoensis TaxID=6573 RepID=A0A210QHG7_MIZYE|nr:TNF receptor-associated factor 3-like [Mizuhopecten yessoensis]XP_021358075.1 TNF receptor-associated factor 3-like [Mizuhopecten yessoensis]XP_021358076.1 TNF receptor-associated factor 3-like [Mizuhopecten yessoensis]OWF48149.1 TNF receptor-associated factor 3 [Mizuhopecten yessoensis]